MERGELKHTHTHTQNYTVQARMLCTKEELAGILRVNKETGNLLSSSQTPRLTAIPRTAHTKPTIR